MHVFHRNRSAEHWNHPDASEGSPLWSSVEAAVSNALAVSDNDHMSRLSRGERYG